MSVTRKYLPIGYWLKRADDLLTSRIDEVQRANDLTRLAWQILNLLHEKGTVGRAELTDTLQPFAEAARVDDMVANLTERGVIGRSVEGGFVLTPTGADLHSRAFQAQQAVRQRAVAGISGEEYATTVSVLQRLVDNLERREPA